MEKDEKRENAQRIESTRIGFGYLGKALDMLVEYPNEAKVILALWKGYRDSEQIAKVTKIQLYHTIKCLHWLVRQKCAVNDPAGYSLTKTGEGLANAWVAFIRALDLNFLPPEQINAINEIISQ